MSKLCLTWADWVCTQISRKRDDIVAHSTSLELPVDEIRAFCERWLIVEFSFFGSVLREDFSPASDLDVLVDFSTDSRWGLFDLSDMKQELEEIFGREVDLLTRAGLNESPNWIRKEEILRTVQQIDLAEN